MKQVKSRLMVLFLSILLITLALIILFEGDVMAAGFGAGLNTTVEFILTAFMEVLTLACAYLSLRLFRFRHVHEDLVTRKAVSLQFWGIVRLSLLGIPMVANTLLYYMYMNPTFGYLAIILALCLPFVYPSTNRCMAETTEEA